MKKDRTLQALFSFQGFKAAQRLVGKFGDSKARIIVLARQKKRQFVQVMANGIRVVMTGSSVSHGMWTRSITEFMYVMKDGESPALSVACE